MAKGVTCFVQGEKKQKKKKKKMIFFPQSISFVAGGVYYY